MLEQEKNLLKKLDLQFVKYLKNGNIFNTLLCRNSENEDLVLKYLKNSSCRAELENEQKLLSSSNNHKYMKRFQVYSSGRDYIVTYFVDGKTFLSSIKQVEDQNDIIKPLVKSIVEFQNMNSSELGLKKTNGYFFSLFIKNVMRLYPQFLNFKDLLKIISLVQKNSLSILKYQKIAHNDLSEVNIFIEKDDIYFLDFARICAGNFMFYDPCFLCLHGPARIENWDWQNKFLNGYIVETKKELNAQWTNTEIRHLLRIGLIAAVLTLNWVMLEIEKVIPVFSPFMNKIGMIRKLKGYEYKNLDSRKIKIRLDNLAFLLDDIKFNNWFNVTIQPPGHKVTKGHK